MSIRAHCILADVYFLFSGAATITAWQEQLEWGLRILAAVVAICAGLASLRHHRRRNRRPIEGRD